MSLTLNQLTHSERMSVKRILTAALAILNELESAQQQGNISDEEIFAMFHALSFCAEEAARYKFDPTYFKGIFTQFVIDEVAKR